MPFTEAAECEGRVRARGVLTEEESTGVGETAQPRHETPEIVTIK